VTVKIVIIGGGIVGLSSALMLGRAGHEVTVLERDDAVVPGSPQEAWQAWQRRGVAQFRQPHFLQAAGYQLLVERLPEVAQALRQAGATAFDSLAMLPPFITDRAPRQGDDRFATLTGRRPVLEYAVAAGAGEHADVRRGVSVTELVTGPAAVDGVPHVTAVRTAEGSEIDADLVIDAMGRRSQLPPWLAALGARPPPEEAEDSGFTYYTRYFASESGQPQFLTGLLTPFSCFSLLTLPGDTGTWSVTVYISSRDQALKDLREVGKWTALVAACPLHAHLLDGEPLTDVLAMSGIVDRRRRLVADGTPVVTGLVAVGDSACCTNPSLGRGITMGMLHARGTADVIALHQDAPLALATAHDEMTQARVTPWYRATVEFDRARKAEIDAVIDDTPAPPPAGQAARFQQAFGTAMLYDPDIFRAMMDIISMHALPAEVLARPGFAGQVAAAAESHEPFVPPGPSRAEVLDMLA
jgi:2-polyprenyl-6-methoxyphenol hydroxylase-like FAD-dependent oxidoreductase